jgi:hypothetical protein
MEMYLNELTVSREMSDFWINNLPPHYLENVEIVGGVMIYDKYSYIYHLYEYY